MRRTLAVVLIALSALFGLSGAAQAKGGPTSVLITDPGSGRATALYYTSPEYDELESLLTADFRLYSPGSAGTRDAQTYQLTWMIHDSEPWRKDAVMVATDGKVYMRTVGTDQDFGGEIVDMKLGRAVHGPELAAFLEEIFAETAPTSPAAQPVIDQEPAAAAPTVVTTRWFSLTGWRWAAPGVLGGLLVGFMVTRQRVPKEARRVLVERGVTT